MKRVHTGILLALALSLLGGARPALASQLNLLPILQLSGQYSDNVFFDENQKQSDTFFLINPGIALDYASRSFVGSLAYQVGLQRYNDFKRRDNDVHRIDATVGFKLTSGWFIDASDNLFITSDPLAFDASGDRLQRDSFTYNHFIPSIAYNFRSGGTRLAARYDRVDVDYDTLVDSRQNGFGGTISTKMGKKSTIAADYLYFKREFDRQNATFNTLDYRGQRFGLRVDRRLSSRISANVFGGYEERKFYVEGELRDFDSVIGEVQLTGEFPGVVSWTMDASQRLNDLAIKGAYKVRRGTLDLRKSVADRLKLEFSGFIQDSENDQLNEQSDMYGLRVEGQYLVAKFLNVWLGYEYLDRDSSQVTPFTENRVNFGLTLSYGL